MIDTSPRKSIEIGRLPGLAVAMSTVLLLGACAGSNENANLLGLTTTDQQSATKEFNDPFKAVAYYAKLYRKDPKNKKVALNYAAALRETGHKPRALAVMRAAAAYHAKDPEFASEYGRAALDNDQVALAANLLARADDPANPDWRIISARGTALAKQGKFEDATHYFERALKLAPSNPSALSNLAMAKAANGDLKSAEGLLRKASAMPQAKPKVHQNLAVVLRLQGRDADATRVLAARLPALRNSVGTASHAAQRKTPSQLAQAKAQ